MYKRPIVFALSVAAAALLPALGNAQLVNGGFELPVQQTFTTYFAGDNSIPGWTVLAGSVDVGSAANNGFIVGPAAEGAQYLDLNGVSAGSIAQTFATTAGTSYTLSFSYANNYVNQPSSSALVSLFDANGNLFAPVSISHNTSVGGILDWTLFSASFTATSNATTLRFDSQVPNSAGGILLDNASVNVVPEPASLACLGIGAMLVARRRRRLQ